jgi:hypothetical protein
MIEDIKSGSSLNLKGHASTVRVLKVLESKDLLVSGGNDKKLIVWDYKGKRRLHTFDNLHKGHIIAIAVAKDSSYFITGSYDSQLKILNVDSKKSVKVVKKLSFTNRVYSICLSNDGTTLFCGGYNKKFFRSWKSFDKTDNSSLQMIKEEQEEDKKEYLMSSILSKVYDNRDPSEMDDLYLSQKPGHFQSKLNESEVLTSNKEENKSLINISINEKTEPSTEKVLPKISNKLFLSQLIPVKKSRSPNRYKHSDIKRLLEPIPKSFGLQMRQSRIQDSKADPIKRAHERSLISKDQKDIFSSGLGRILNKEQPKSSRMLDNDDKPKKFLENTLESEKKFLGEIKTRIKKLKIESEEIEECKSIKNELGKIHIDIQLRESKVSKSRIKALKMQSELINKLKQEHEGK